MPTIYIDDKPYQVPEGNNVLEACLSAKIDLPYFCWHPEMGSVGACRQCALVQYRDENDTQGRVVMGCMTPVTEGARFSMSGEKASEFRENIVESLMLNHPHDCPVCAEGGECHLQDMTVMVGHRNRRYRGKKNTHNNQYLGPLINHEMNRCITCYRCTRFYNDYAGGTDLSAQGAHDQVYFGRQEDGTLESEFAGNLVEVCPTGVFTDKPLVNDYTRKWDLQSAPSICGGCALGCNTMPGERYGKLKRIHNRFNNEVNGYFLCDRGRYGSDFVNDENRAQFAGLRRANGKYDAVDAATALKKITSWCGGMSKVAAIGSPRASLETNYLLRKLVGSKNYANGISDSESQLLNEVANILQTASVINPSMRKAEDADVVLILGEDVTNTAPRLALALRQSVRNLAKQMATDMRIALWQDEAVRVLAQDKLSPLYIASMPSTRLDDVAAQTVNLSPINIARFGFAIAAEIDTSLPNVDGFDQETSDLITLIAKDLKSAKQPLIVSGTGSQSLAVIQAASSIANALNKDTAMLCYCLPENNSLGATLMQDGSESSVDEICHRAAKGEIDTLIIAENDLYRRASKKQIDKLFKDVSKLIVLDAIDSPTFSQAALVLPAASLIESQGTLISSEGRAQRHYPVFLPAEQRQASWRWLRKLGQSLKLENFDLFNHFDDVTSAIIAEFPVLKDIGEASPKGDFRNRGVKIPRQTHRNSGRTAMLADISVHEPKQAVDEDTPLAYTMEGANGRQPASLIPFVWSPGWNSNQSLHKFQSETGGALAGGTPGKRLFEFKAQVKAIKYSIPESLKTKKSHFQALPLYRIFGSEELSVRCPAIEELSPQSFIQLNQDDAVQLNVEAGDLVSMNLADGDEECLVEINPSIPANCAGYTIGLPSSSYLAPESFVSLTKSKGGENV